MSELGNEEGEASEVLTGTIEGELDDFCTNGGTVVGKSPDASINKRLGSTSLKSHVRCGSGDA